MAGSSVGVPSADGGVGLGVGVRGDFIVSWAGWVGLYGVMGLV